MALPEIRGPYKPKNNWLTPDPPVTLSEAAQGKGGSYKAADLYFRIPEVRRVIDFVAHSIALVPWHVYKREGDSRERIADSPAEILLRHPDPERGVTGYSLVRSMVTDMMVYGYALCLLYDDRPTHIPAPLVGQTVDSIGRQTELYVSVDGEKQIVHDMPCALVADWTPHGGLGKSPLLTLAQYIAEQEAANKYHSILYREAVKITGQFNRPAGEVWSDKARRIFTQQIQEYKDRAAGGAPVLEDGIEYKPVNPLAVLSPADVAARNDFAIQVATYFGVMPELVGLRSGNYGSVTAYRQMLYGPSIGHYIEALQGALNEQIVPALAGQTEQSDEPGEEGDIFGEFDVLSVSEGTALEKAMTLQTSVGAPIMTAAEARASMRLPFIEGTDELVLPANVSRGDQDQEDEQQDEDKDPRASDTDTGKQNVNGASQDRNNRGRDRAKERLSHKTKGVQKSEDRVNDADPEYGILAAMLLMYLPEMTKDVSSLASAAFKSKWTPVLAAAAYPLLAGAASGASIQEQMAHHPSSSATLGGDLLSYMQAFARGEGARLASAVYDSMSPAKGQDEDSDEYQHALLDRNSRVALISDIAHDNAKSVGREHGAKQAGAVGKIWHHSGAVKDPRHPHVQMEGERITLGERFSNGSRFPRDPFVADPAGENVNCHCFTEYVYER